MKELAELEKIRKQALTDVAAGGLTAALHQQLADVTLQLIELTTGKRATFAMPGVWEQTEKVLAAQKDGTGLLLLVMPYRGGTGVGASTFVITEVANLVIPESRKKYFGEIAHAAWNQAATAIARTRERNGGG